MRQAVFAILLILAAFSGGALVNGPGLGWAQRHLSALAEHLPTDFGTSSEGNEEESDSLDNEEGVSLDLSESSIADAEPESQAPRLPRNALPVAVASPFSDPVEKTGSSNSGTFRGPDDSGAPLEEPVRAPRGPSIGSARTEIPEADVDSKSHSPRALPTPPPSLLDSARSKLANERSGTVSETNASASPTASSPDSDLEIVQAEVAVGADATVPPGARNSSDPSIRLVSSSGHPGSGPQELAEWVEVHRRMVELGVGRFWVEGDFGGPVHFRCVVPVVGDRAVSQHFEAEGDNLLSAARVALKRIALWRATEDLP